MIEIIPSTKRHFNDFGWLQTYWLFSFSNYYDPDNLQHGKLRVFNDDVVKAHTGFPRHPHEEMEIISIIINGEMTHEDSMGNKMVIHGDEVQRMSAGTGLTHSEFNHSDQDPLHFLQIWIIPERPGLQPGYEQKPFTSNTKEGGFTLIGDRLGTDGAITIHQDIRLYIATVEAGQRFSHTLPKGRHGWLQIMNGVTSLMGGELRAGDGVGISEEPDALEMEAGTDTQVVLFDMA